jgi:hypothetical protein
MKKQPGRKSGAAMEIAAVIDTAATYLRAPAYLPEELRKRVDAIIKTRPPNWFIESDLPMLADLARHIERSEDIDRELREVKGTAGAARLRKQASVESQRIQSLSRGLRLTVSTQSRVRGNMPGGESITDGKPKPPWELENDQLDFQNPGYGTAGQMSIRSRLGIPEPPPGLPMCYDRGASTPEAIAWQKQARAIALAHGIALDPMMTGELHWPTDL